MPEFCSSRKLSNVLIKGVMVLLALATYTTPALAHRVIIFAYAEGNTIYTESNFVPASPVRHGKILVMDNKTGKLLLTGTTDDHGKFSFKIPAVAIAKKMDLNIVVEAAMGHRGAWLLKAANYLPNATPVKDAAAATATPAAAAPAAPQTKTAEVDQQALETAVNKILMRQLGPINEKLTELTIHRTTLPDVLGGIGYIFGLFGLWAYFQSTRKKSP
jgi:nickel transport protein